MYKHHILNTMFHAEYNESYLVQSINGWMIDSYFMALHLSQTQNHMRFLYVPAPKIAQSVPIAHVPSFENVIFVKL